MDMFVDVCVSKNQIRYKNPVLLWSTIAYTAADYVLILILISHIICLGCTMLDWKNYQQQLRFFFSFLSETFKLQLAETFRWKLKKMVFCYQNCSDLLWEKIVLVIEKYFWNSRLKAENLQNFSDHWNNLFKQWKDRAISGNRMLF